MAKTWNKSNPKRCFIVKLFSVFILLGNYVYIELCKDKFLTTFHFFFLIYNLPSPFSLSFQGKKFTWAVSGMEQQIQTFSIVTWYEFDDKFYDIFSLLLILRHFCDTNENYGVSEYFHSMESNQNQEKLGKPRIALIHRQRYYHCGIYLLCARGFYCEMKQNQKIVRHKIRATRKRRKCLTPYHLIELFITRDFHCLSICIWFQHFIFCFRLCSNFHVILGALQGFSNHFT